MEAEQCALLAALTVTTASLPTPVNEAASYLGLEAMAAAAADMVVVGMGLGSTAAAAAR